MSAPPSICFPYWTWLSQEPFFIAPLLPQEENTIIHFQNNGYPLIIPFWGKMFGNHVVLSIFIIVLFFFSGISNGTGHWKLCNIPFVIALMLSSEERGILNQRESDAKIYPLFLNTSRFSAVRCMVTWAIFGMSNNFCRQKQNKRNQTQDYAVWGDGHFTLEFYPQ